MKKKNEASNVRKKNTALLRVFSLSQSNYQVVAFLWSEFYAASNWQLHHCSYHFSLLRNFLLIESTAAAAAAASKATKFSRTN